MTTLSDEYVEKKHTFYIQLILSENLSVYAIVWNNRAQPERPHVIK
jgi:hypothetical protein